MPLSLTKGYQLATDPVFQQRVAMAFYFVARQVVEESRNTRGWFQRRGWWPE